MIFDVNSVSSKRTTDSNGFLRVSECNITKEQVRPYLGKEIPNWQSFGLEPDAIYGVFCPADELIKAAPTFNNLPLTRKHIEVNIDNIPSKDIVGSLGDSCEFESPYLKNSLLVYDRAEIKAITNGRKKELSCGYRYTPVRQQGVFNGQPYDFVMTNIQGNHVALVHAGRAGHDVMVADEELNMIEDKEELEWITVNGNHVPVKKGQSKEEAVKSFIEGKQKSSKEVNQFGRSAKEKKVKELEEKVGKALEENNKEKYEAYNEQLKIEKQNLADLDKAESSLGKMNEGVNSELYQSWVDNVKENYPDLAKNFHIASEKEFKEMTGLSAEEYVNKYPMEKEDIKWKKDGLGEKVVLKAGNKKIVVRKNGDVRWYKDGKLLTELNQNIGENDVDKFIIHGVKKGYAVDEIPSELEEPQEAGEKVALIEGETRMAEEAKTPEEEVKEKIISDACSKDEDKEEAKEKKADKPAESKEEKKEEEKDFAEGVKYGEEKEKEEPKKLDSEHESEGMKKAEKKKEAEDKCAKDEALAMDIDAIKAEAREAGRQEAIEDFKAREKARKEVRHLIGDVNVFAFDSADEIYKMACEKGGLDCKEISSFKDAFKGLSLAKSKLVADAAPAKSDGNEECFNNIRLG